MKINYYMNKYWYEQMMKMIEFDYEITKLIEEMSTLERNRYKEKWPLKGYIPPKHLRLPWYEY